MTYDENRMDIIIEGGLYLQKEQDLALDITTLEDLRKGIRLLNTIQRPHSSTLWDLDVCIASAIAKLKLQQNG